MMLAAVALLTWVGANALNANPPGQEVPEGVLHLVSVHRSTDSDGVEGPQIRLEIWVDPETGDARLERTESGTLTNLQVRRANTFQEYSPAASHLITRSFVEEDAYLLQIENKVWFYRKALALGTVQQKGETTLNGRPVIEIKVPGFDAELPKKEVMLDKDTLLPVQVTYFQTREGEVIPAETEEIAYEIVEYVSRQTLPGSLFELTAPAGASLENGYQLTMAEVREFREFELYCLQEAFAGFVLFDILDFESVPKDVPPVRIVQFIYRKAPSDTEGPRYLFVQNFPAATRPERIMTPTPLQTVTVNGIEAILWERAGGTRAEVRLGDAIVEVSGPSRDIVEGALNALVKANPAW